MGKKEKKREKGTQRDFGEGAGIVRRKRTTSIGRKRNKNRISSKETGRWCVAKKKGQPLAVGARENITARMAAKKTASRADRRFGSRWTKGLSWGGADKRWKGKARRLLKKERPVFGGGFLRKKTPSGPRRAPRKKNAFGAENEKGDRPSPGGKKKSAQRGQS